MKIYSMTATFGKLEHETLTLHPGLNIIHAPNEWGKSTWCAFLVAMLYGVETRVHSTKTALADKERYAPWSGSPMSGRMDIQWNGRDITIERSSKGRSVFGVFRAYETATGLEVPELRADNCGQLLLGVEKSVFVRSGFLRLSDLPVTQDETLRRRLNALVTTGDESGTADTLAQKLRDLKNRCRANRANGLLPQAEAQRSDLENKLAELKTLQEQSVKILCRQQELEHYQKQLANHQAALEYEKNQTFAGKLAQAQAQEAQALSHLEAVQNRCTELPAADIADGMLLQLDQLQSGMHALQMDAQLLPACPMAPELPAAFQNQDPATLSASAAANAEAFAQAALQYRRKLGLIAGILIALLSLGLLMIPHWIGVLGAGIGTLVGLALVIVHFLARHRAAATMEALRKIYSPLEPETWVQAAEAAISALAQYQEAVALYEEERAAIAQRAQALKEENTRLTGGQPLAQCRQYYLDARASWQALSEARKEHYRAAQLVQALQSSHKAVAPAPFPDNLTHNEAETTRLLSDCTWEQRQLHERLGRCRGRMEALGTGEALVTQLQAVERRIQALEDTYAALEIAQQTLTTAATELQRRFAPQISQRAQEIFRKLTDGRYTRLTLADDLTLHAGAQDEDTLRSALWRSDGTMDQLYLALRLAVSEALTPDAPLILDDALVRFDDQRLAEAVDLLLEASEHKQVILFSCQTRELDISKNRRYPQCE